MLPNIWKKLNGKFQWFLIWIFHPKFNVGLSIIIPDLQGRVLLAEHVYSGPKPWRLIGGYINKNENIYKAACREAKEELGIDIEIERILRIRTGFAYRIEITLIAKPIDMSKLAISNLASDLASISDIASAAGSNSGLNINKKEIKSIGWFTMENTPTNTLESHLELIKLYKEKPAGHFEVTNM